MALAGVSQHTAVTSLTVLDNQGTGWGKAKGWLGTSRQKVTGARCSMEGLALGPRLVEGTSEGQWHGLGAGVGEGRGQGLGAPEGKGRLREKLEVGGAKREPRAVRRELVPMWKCRVSWRVTSFQL